MGLLLRIGFVLIALCWPPVLWGLPCAWAYDGNIDAARTQAQPLPACPPCAFEELLEQVDQQTRRIEAWLGSANVAIGVGHVVGASFAMHREATGPAIGTFVGAGFSLASGLMGLTFGRAPFRAVRATFDDQKGVVSAEQATSRTYEAWRRQAHRTRRFRTLFGGAMATTGALMVGFATANLVANIPWPTPHSDNDNRAAFGGVLLGLSGFVLVNGLTLAWVPSPIETRLPHQIACAHTSLTQAPAVHLATLPRGALVQLSLPL